jgi:Spy/CpxP family protein refolding chaperone
MIRKKADLKIARLELRELLHKEPVDMNAVEAQAKKTEGLRTAMLLDAIKAREEVKSKLTPEQRKKLRELFFSPERSKSRASKEKKRQS